MLVVGFYQYLSYFRLSFALLSLKIELYILIHVFFYIRNTFINNARLRLAENQTSARQHPEAEVLIFEHYLHSSTTLSSKSTRAHRKKNAKEQGYLYSWDYTINHNEYDEKIPHKYGINRPRPRHGRKYSKNITCLSL